MISVDWLKDLQLQYRTDQETPWQNLELTKFHSTDNGHVEIAYQEGDDTVESLIPLKNLLINKVGFRIVLKNAPTT